MSVAEKEVLDVENDAPVDSTETSEAEVSLQILKGDEKVKEEIYQAIADYANQRVQKAFTHIANRALQKKGLVLKMRPVFGDRFGRDVMVAVFEGLLNILSQKDENGRNQPRSVPIPGGFGSLQLMVAAATRKVTPQGNEVDVPRRWRLKYSPGKTVEDRFDVLTTPPEATKNTDSE